LKLKRFMIEQLKEKAINGIVSSDIATINFNTSSDEDIDCAFLLGELENMLIHINQHNKLIHINQNNKKATSSDVLTEFKNRIQKLFKVNLNLLSNNEIYEIYSQKEIVTLMNNKDKLLKKDVIKIFGVVEEKIEAAEREEHNEKLLIADGIIDAAYEKGITQITKPIIIKFKFDDSEYLVHKYSLDMLKEVKHIIENMSSPRPNFKGDMDISNQNIIDAAEREEHNEKLVLADGIIDAAYEKGITQLTKPIIINFELDDPEDLAYNYSLDMLKEVKHIIGNMSSLRKSFKGDMDISNHNIINTMDFVYKYKNGEFIEEINEINETDDWRLEVPKILLNKITSEMSIDEAHERVGELVKLEQRYSPRYMTMMEFKIDLGRYIFEKNDEVINSEQDELAEHEFAEFVRITVESIILPHIEVLEKVQETKGNIQFVDIWQQHFSEKLKQEVRQRDGFKCVVCDEETNLHVHHKVPRKLGGPNHLDNLVTLCASCHGAIETANLEKAYKKCMSNYMRSKVSIQKSDLSKDTHQLKQEVLEQLDALFMKTSLRDEALAGEVLDILRKIENIFD